MCEQAFYKEGFTQNIVKTMEVVANTKKNNIAAVIMTVDLQ